MKSLIKSVMLLSVYHVAKGAVQSIEQEINQEDKKEKSIKRKLLAAHMLHTLLGTIYND